MAGWFSAPKPPTPDPALVQQQQTASAMQAQSLQSGLSNDTLNILRQFGQANAMAGAKIVASPFSAAAGGFTNQFLSAGGAPLMGTPTIGAGFGKA